MGVCGLEPLQKLIGPALRRQTPVARPSAPFEPQARIPCLAISLF
jgi:hypothetical protein